MGARRISEPTDLLPWVPDRDRLTAVCNKGADSLNSVYGSSYAERPLFIVAAGNDGKLGRGTVNEPGDCGW
jgi:hypothetical protein